jgi:hypothetical protein
MKSLAIAFMLMLGLSVVALQSTNTPNIERTQRATEQASPNITNPAIDKLTTADGASDHRVQPQAKAESQDKMFLDLGSMPCPPDDQQCRAKEKRRLEAPDERP